MDFLLGIPAKLKSTLDTLIVMLDLMDGTTTGGVHVGGFVKSVQYRSAAAGTVTIAAVDVNKTVVLLNTSIGYGSDGTQDGVADVSVTLNNSTQIVFVSNNPGGGPAAIIHAVVIEFF